MRNYLRERMPSTTTLTICQIVSCESYSTLTSQNYDLKPCELLKAVLKQWNKHEENPKMKLYFGLRVFGYTFLSFLSRPKAIL